MVQTRNQSKNINNFPEPVFKKTTRKKAKSKFLDTIPFIFKQFQFISCLVLLCTDYSLLLYRPIRSDRPYHCYRSLLWTPFKLYINFLSENSYDESMVDTCLHAHTNDPSYCCKPNGVELNKNFPDLRKFTKKKVPCTHDWTRLTKVLNGMLCYYIIAV